MSAKQFTNIIYIYCKKIQWQNQSLSNAWGDSERKRPTAMPLNICKQSDSQFSNSPSNSNGVFRFICFICTALWLSLSKALFKSIEQNVNSTTSFNKSINRFTYSINSNSTPKTYFRARLNITASYKLSKHLLRATIFEYLSKSSSSSSV